MILSKEDLAALQLLMNEGRVVLIQKTLTREQKEHLKKDGRAARLSINDLLAFDAWIKDSTPEYAPADSGLADEQRSKWLYRLPEGGCMAGHGKELSTFLGKLNSKTGIYLDEWLYKILGKIPPKSPEPPPTSFEDFMKRWKNYAPEERKSYMGLFPGKFKKGSAVDLAVAALDGNPNPLDMDMKGMGNSPTDLDLMEEP